MVPLRCRPGALALTATLLVAWAASRAPVNARTPPADVDLILGSPSGTIQPLRGINVGPLGNVSQGTTFPDLIAAYQTRGVNYIRTHDFKGPLDMYTMYPDRTKDPLLSTSFNFTGIVGNEFHSSDQTYRSIVDNGFQAYFRLGDSNNQSGSNTLGPPTAAERPNWEQAALQVIRHYRDGQWNGVASTIPYVEIWNEPNNQSFWSLTDTEYQQLYVELATLLKTNIPALTVGGPGVSSSGCTSNAVGRPWVRAFLDAVRTAGAPLDFFSWHLYSNNPDDFTTCANFYRTELNNRGYTSTVMIVSEWNTEVQGLSDTEAVDLRANARGAAVDTASWINMQAAGVAQELFYKGPEPATDAGMFYGMFRSSGVPKKVGYAAELWNTFTQYPTRRLLSGSAATFYAIAGANSSGIVAVLVSNNSSSARTWTLSQAGSNFTVKTVSDSADGVVNSTTTSGSFTIPAYGVQLVATAGPAFTDDPITAGSTRVKAVHITELRAAIDALRVRNGLATYGWTDGSLSTGATALKSVHIAEMRTALAAAYAAAGRSMSAFTDPTLSAGTSTVKAVHIAELRAAIAALW